MLRGIYRGLTTALPLLCVVACGDDDPAANAGGGDAAVIEHRKDAATPDVRELDASLPVMDAAMVRWESLLEQEEWRRYDAAIDPLKSHQPETIVCYESATYLEYDSFEVDTTRCNYLLATVPARRAAPAGSTVRVDMLHFDLQAPAPAEAHLAILFGDVLQWETSIPIPAPGNQVRATFQTKSALDFRDPIRLHLHNHGGNTYLLTALEVQANVTP